MSSHVFYIFLSIVHWYNQNSEIDFAVPLLLIKIWCFFKVLERHSDNSTGAKNFRRATHSLTINETFMSSQLSFRCMKLMETYYVNDSCCRNNDDFYYWWLGLLLLQNNKGWWSLTVMMFSGDRKSGSVTFTASWVSVSPPYQTFCRRRRIFNIYFHPLSNCHPSLAGGPAYIDSVAVTSLTAR